MRSYLTQIVLFAFVGLFGVGCFDDLDDKMVKVAENLIYQDLDVSSSWMECQAHEKYSECFGDRLCQKTCENIDQWEEMPCATTKICIRGCICEDGFVRENYNGICVGTNSCLEVKH